MCDLTNKEVEFMEKLSIVLPLIVVIVMLIINYYAFSIARQTVNVFVNISRYRTNILHLCERYYGVFLKILQ